MALAPGSRLGPYEILAPLGTGGMGEVYRAHDTKLNRDVTLKVLSDAFTRDADRLARFKREAQVLGELALDPQSTLGVEKLAKTMLAKVVNLVPSARGTP